MRTNRVLITIRFVSRRIITEENILCESLGAWPDLRGPHAKIEVCEECATTTEYVDEQNIKEFCEESDLECSLIV